MPTLIRRLAVLLTAVAALLLTAVGSASAHAALLSTDPAQGSVLATAPGAVTLRFSETVVLETDAVRVFDPAGKRVDTGSSAHAGSDASTARVALGAALPQGTYTVAWRVVSADSHPVAGAFTFSLGHASATSAATGPTGGDGLVGFLYGASRTVQYAAFALLFGAVGLVLLCWPGGLRVRGIPRLALAGWAGLLVATIAQLLLRGPYEAGTGIGKAVDLTVLQQVLGERLGTLLVVRVLLLAAVGVFLALLGGAMEDARQRAGLVAGAALLAVGLGCTWALGDHASVGMQSALAVPLDVVHLLAMGLWLGGLAAVWLGLRADMPAASADRFSRVALVCVTALVATGSYQSWRGVGSWGALTSTTYGRLLLVKIGLVVVILAAAWISRRWVALLRTDPDPAPAPEPATEPATDSAATALRAEGVGVSAERRGQLERQERVREAAAVRRAREAAPARGMLGRSVALEALFAGVVLVVTTLLTNSPPGRAVAEQQAAAAVRPVDVTFAYDTGGSTAGAKGKATVDIDPARTGVNTVHVYLYDRSGRPVDVPEVNLSLTLPARNLGPLNVRLTKLDLGHWGSTSLSLPLAGAWTLSTSIRSDDIDEATVTTPVTIG